MIDFLCKVEDGWWKGRLNGRVGVFPSNFVEATDHHLIFVWSSYLSTVFVIVKPILGMEKNGISFGFNPSALGFGTSFCYLGTGSRVLYTIYPVKSKQVC
jgi:hypothetical protein